MSKHDASIRLGFGPDTKVTVVNTKPEDRKPEPSLYELAKLPTPIEFIVDMFKDDYDKELCGTFAALMSLQFSAKLDAEETEKMSEMTEIFNKDFYMVQSHYNNFLDWTIVRESDKEIVASMMTEEKADEIEEHDKRTKGLFESLFKPKKQEQQNEC